ncbi:hypothetical protein BCR44DRAFT_1516123 [Catenaria anguillulae PL171]|uniref:PhoD-like phosphatase domain-containing protein n=1 Tax=Catenaria anguillulae PL171 TaxID=765915 RepID=A0A1Y2HBP6_9FUNG|nr:hypothetical protein BCR44DRAFT_1516123 [Catenaria anguillulae PL171]
MSFFSKLSGSLKDLTEQVTNEVSKLTTKDNAGGAQPAAAAAHGQGNGHHAAGQHQHQQHGGLRFVQPAPESRAPFVGPFIKFVTTDLQANANRYSILVVVKPGSNDAPFLRMSLGGALGVPILLDQYADHKFWRIDVAVPLQPHPQQVMYSVNYGPDNVFHIPGRDEPYRWMFHSCNGFSSDVVEEEKAALNGIKPLWTDVMREHAKQPFHAQMGGGDQVYMDEVWNSATLKPWIENPNKEYKKTAPYTEEMNREVHKFYFDEYMKHFQLDGFREALAQIPFNFTWDDHDIFDGYGSYPEYLRCSPVMQNMFVAAQRFYLLFQHHTNLQLARQDGYLGVHGHSAVKQYGPYMAFVTVDVRTERTLTQICSPESWELVWQAIERLAPTTRHIIWGATIPLVWPRMMGEGAIEYAGTAMLKITSAMDGIASLVSGEKKSKEGRSEIVKLFQKSAVYTNVLNSLGEPELLDDLNDHWTAENHVAERTKAIERFQEISRRRGNCRVTFLSGDVHCCGVGKLYSSDPSLRSDETKDHRLMMQVVSSAIGNKAPPGAVITILHKSAAELDMDQHTKEAMVPLFLEDLAGQPLQDQYVYGARNWCRVTVPQSRPDSLMFEIMVEKVQGDPNGETKPYGVIVPGLAL